jgi:flagella basal body P-ring formation protein FlgA
MIRLLALLSVLFLSHLQTAYAFDVTFKKMVEVDDALVKLGDVATIDTVSEFGKALLTIPVANAPEPGETTYFRTANIKKYLSTSQSLPDNIDWAGAPSIKVTRKGTFIDSTRMLDIIAEYLRSQKDNLPLAIIHFVPTALPLPFTLPTGDLNYQVIPSNPGILNSSRFSIIFNVDDRVVKNMSVRGRVEAQANIITAATPVKKGTILEAHHLQEAVLDISDIKDPGFSPDEFIGKKITRSISASTPITMSMVESLPVVHRGEKVKIVIQSGVMMLTATGLAHSDGKIDELIKVQNINSNKVIFGRVTAPGIVEVML